MTPKDEVLASVFSREACPTPPSDVSKPTPDSVWGALGRLGTRRLNGLPISTPCLRDVNALVELKRPSRGESDQIASPSIRNSILRRQEIPQSHPTQESLNDITVESYVPRQTLFITNPSFCELEE